jgi:hypothetical protein
MGFFDAPLVLVSWGIICMESFEPKKISQLGLAFWQMNH